MNTVKWELEDLAFATLYPKRYDEIAALLASEGPKDAQNFAKLSKEYSDLSPVVQATTRSAQKSTSRRMVSAPSIGFASPGR